jgi:hypothetical protein
MFGALQRHETTSPNQHEVLAQQRPEGNLGTVNVHSVRDGSLSRHVEVRAAYTLFPRYPRSSCEFPRFPIVSPIVFRDGCFVTVRSSATRIEEIVIQDLSVHPTCRRVALRRRRTIARRCRHSDPAKGDRPAGGSELRSRRRAEANHSRSSRP